MGATIMRSQTVALVLLLVAPPLVSAHPQPTGWATGEITGFITAPDSSGLPGVRVSVRELGGMHSRVVVAGSRGVYRIQELPAGEYQLRAELKGFEPWASTVVLAEGERKTVDFTLPIATIREIVTVVSALPRDGLEAAEARETAARDVGEALSGTTGISKVRKGGIANDVVLRGFQGANLNVLIDGLRVYGACPNHMDPPAFHVDFAEVDRIEVGKGPHDMRNQGSLGGVVNIVTRKPESGLHASGNLSSGSYGYVNPSATVSYANELFSASGGFSYRASDPFTDGSGKLFTRYGNYRPTLQESDAFRVGSGWAGFSASPRQNHLVQVSYTRQQADHVLYPYLQMDAIYDDTDRINFGYRVDDLQGPLRSLRVQGYYTQVSHWMTDEYRTSSSSVPRAYSMGTMAITRTVGGKFEAGIRDLTLGVEVFNWYWNTMTEMAGMAYRPQASIPGVDSSSAGIYADYRKPLSDRFRLELGGRVDRTHTQGDPTRANTDLYYAYNSTRSLSRTDVHYSGSTRMVYSITDGVEISGGIGRTARIPDAMERYFSLRRAGSDWVGNPELEPSRNTGIDGELALRHRGFSLTSIAYSNWISNYITVRRASKLHMLPGIMNSDARSYENVGARIYGTEMHMVYSMTSQLYLSSGLSYARGTKNQEPDKGIFSANLAEMPPLSSSTSLRFDTGRISAEVEGVFAGRQSHVDADLREEPTAGYGVANIRLGAHWNRIALVLGLNNVFDRLFREHLSYQRDPFRSGVRVFEPGRNVFANLSYRF
jgi:iron complex outermembrane receptor protein